VGIDFVFSGWTARVRGIFVPPKSHAYCDVGLEHQPEATIITVAGEVDLFAAPTLVAALEHARLRSKPVVVDLSACSFFDSAGLTALLRAHLAAEADGRELVIARAPDSCPERLLELSVPGHFAAHATRDDAVAALAG
jgi:anti-sigma B factor antagonist